MALTRDEMKDYLVKKGVAHAPNVSDAKLKEIYEMTLAAEQQPKKATAPIDEGEPVPKGMKRAARKGTVVCKTACFFLNRYYKEGMTLNVELGQLYPKHFE